jgi:ABC-2 type transport system ATP-binding protein
MAPTAQSVSGSSHAEAGSKAIVVRGLRKSYGDVLAVKDIDFEIERGEIFAFLGANGAGKTTTLEILEGYRSRDGGEVSVLGIDPGRHPEELRQHIGIVLQSTGVDRYLSVHETVAMYAGYYPRARPVDELLELVGLSAKKKTRVLKLSGGQQRRLDVAIALAGDPELLFLDEPTTGFDPLARREAWQVVRNLADLGKTVLLTTHYMDEAQFLADELAVIADGRIVARGTPGAIAGLHAARATVRFCLPDGQEPPSQLAVAPLRDGMAEFTPDDLAAALHDLTGWALEHRIGLESLEIVRPSLEDAYLRLTGTDGLAVDAAIRMVH